MRFKNLPGIDDSTPVGLCAPFKGIKFEDKNCEQLRMVPDSCVSTATGMRTVLSDKQR